MTGDRKISSVLVLLIIFTVSCTYYKNKIYIPPVSEETPTLEAPRVESPPNTLNSPYWATADYMVVNAGDIIKEKVTVEDGLLNVNGMYNGLTDFNDGMPAELILKAAHDNEYLYILATWQDTTLNPSFSTWLFNGPGDPRKQDDSLGWTSQMNDDNLILSFDKGGSRDIWKWSLALSEPMGYVIDMFDDGSGWQTDEGDNMFVRNTEGDDNRTGPKYEWNGEAQELERDPAGFTVLDAGYYILNSTEFLGDGHNGNVLYQARCAYCHGEAGEGHGSFFPDSPPLNESGKYNKFTREALDNLIGDTVTHDSRGVRNWNRFSDEEKLDVGGRLKAFSGIPGYYLQVPSGSSSDIRAYSNVQLGGIKVDAKNAGYSVLLIRKLQTNNSDDIQFNLNENRIYDLNVYLTDEDDLNLIGEENKQLTFR